MLRRRCLQQLPACRASRVPPPPPRLCRARCLPPVPHPSNGAGRAPTPGKPAGLHPGLGGGSRSIPPGDAAPTAGAVPLPRLPLLPLPSFLILREPSSPLSLAHLPCHLSAALLGGENFPSVPCSIPPRRTHTHTHRHGDRGTAPPVHRRPPPPPPSTPAPPGPGSPRRRGASSSACCRSRRTTAAGK